MKIIRRLLVALAHSICRNLKVAVDAQRRAQTLAASRSRSDSAISCLDSLRNWRNSSHSFAAPCGSVQPHP